MQSTYAIIAAGGKGRRMGRPKQFLKIAGKPMLEWTISAFDKCKMIDKIIVVVNKNDTGKVKKFKSKKVEKVVLGGKERQDSVKNGLKALPNSAEIVVIHDGARPAVTKKIIEQSIKAARKYGAAVVGVPIKDTIKQVSSKHYAVERTVDRNQLWAAQTPQAFRTSIIKKAYAKLRGKITDDAMAVEKLGIQVKMIMGSYENIKVTTPEDLRMIETILTPPRPPMAESAPLSIYDGERNKRDKVNRRKKLEGYN